MVSEGVDIPRLRVGVFATTTTTELFFRQAVGRLVRWTRGRAAPAGVLVHPRRPAPARATPPRSPSSAATACAAATTTRRRTAALDAERASSPSAPSDEQLSLFAVDLRRGHRQPAEPGEDEPWPSRTAPTTTRPTTASRSRSPRPHRWPRAPTGARRRRARRARGARRSSTCATRTPRRPASSSALTGLTHAQVNAELNRQVGAEAGRGGDAGPARAAAARGRAVADEGLIATGSGTAGRDGGTGRSAVGPLTTDSIG